MSSMRGYFRGVIWISKYTEDPRYSKFELIQRRLGKEGIKPFTNMLWTLKGITPHLIVRGDILHNILLRVMKHLMEWTEGFLKKHKQLDIFDKIWDNIPPYPRYRQLGKRYWQITMWSGVEMWGVNRVLLACFAAAVRQTKEPPSLSVAAQADCKIAIRCIHAITDFCLIAQYRSHTPETIAYMKKYLQEFHECMHVFQKCRAMKADREEAARASKKLVEGQAQQAMLEQYFMLTPSQ